MVGRDGGIKRQGKFQNTFFSCKRNSMFLPMEEKDQSSNLSGTCQVPISALGLSAVRPESRECLILNSWETVFITYLFNCLCCYANENLAIAFIQHSEEMKHCMHTWGCAWICMGVCQDGNCINNFSAESFCLFVIWNLLWFKTQRATSRLKTAVSSLKDGVYFYAP